MLELHDVIFRPRQQPLSLMVEDGKLACISGPKGSGKTSVLRAVMGLLPIDGGHISIDGELLTPRSAPYFRRHMAYVPSRLMPIPGQDTVGDVRRMLFSLRSNRALKPQEGGADNRRWSSLTLTEQYLELLACAAQQQRSIVVVDQPPCEFDDAAASEVLILLRRMTSAGASVVVVSNNYHIKMNSQTQIQF